MNSEQMDEQVAEYERIKVEAQASMRGMINTIGIDKAVSVVATVHGSTLKDVMGLEGLMRAVYEAGALAQLNGGIK